MKSTINNVILPIKYFVSDINFLYAKKSILKKMFGIITNPSLHACFLIRMCQFSSKYTYWLWRNLLILKHSIDVGYGAAIGFSLRLPHPLGIVIGGGSILGDRLTLYQNVTLGSKRNAYPTVGKDVFIYPNAVLVGGITIGDDCILGANIFLDKDMSKNTIYRG